MEWVIVCVAKQGYWVFFTVMTLLYPWLLFAYYATEYISSYQLTICYTPPLKLYLYLQFATAKSYFFSLIRCCYIFGLVAQLTFRHVVAGKSWVLTIAAFH